jgi:GTP cyclohydrolase III
MAKSYEEAAAEVKQLMKVSGLPEATCWGMMPGEAVTVARKNKIVGPEKEARLQNINSANFAGNPVVEAVHVDITQSTGDVTDNPSTNSSEKSNAEGWTKVEKDPYRSVGSVLKSLGVEEVEK